MEELRRAAVAYYNRSPQDYKEMAMKFFNSMDANRDGRVSFDEFMQFLQWNGYDWVDPRSWFPSLDANHDRQLDFWEVLTFYYVLKTRGVWCSECRTQLHALYFSCVECFDAGRPYDLCSNCYGGNFCHHHRLFLDSYVLLRSKVGVPGEDVRKAITQPRPKYNFTNYFTWLEFAFSAANLASTLSSCNIM